MANIETLKDRTSGETVYPITSTGAVIDPLGRDLETRFAAERAQTDNSLKDYAKATDLTEGLAAKQDRLRTSDDLFLSEENMLSLTQKGTHILFDKAWELLGGTVTVPGKVYGCNGIEDISADEAFEMYLIAFHHPIEKTDGRYANLTISHPRLRTVLPVVWNGYVPNWDNIFIEAANLLAVTISSGTGWARNTFRNCRKLEIINGNMLLGYADSAKETFTNCAALREVRFSIRGCSVDIHWSPLLSYDSVAYIASRSMEQTSPQTITVHGDVYAKLTGDTTNAAAAALSPEELAQWQQVLTDAVAKNISFATV